jgi:nucleoside 2-deoxyribosyltransferase
MNIYLAGPLFTLAERKFNEELGAELERHGPSLLVVLPQRYDTEFRDTPDFCKKVFDCAIESINRCDAVVAIVDGSDADSGTCIEIGYAKGLGKRVIGVRTDFRGSQEHGLNLMVARICDHLITDPSTTTTLDRLAGSIVKVLMDGGIDHRPLAKSSRRPEAIQFQ